MKRVSAVLMAIVMLLSMVCTITVVHAEGANVAVLTVAPDKAAVKRGEDVVLTIGVANATVDLSAIAVELSFDDADLAYKSADLSAYPGGMADEIVAKAGSVKLPWLPVDNADKGEAYTLGTVTMTAKADAVLGDTDVAVSAFEAASNDDQGIPFDVTIGGAVNKVTVECAHSFEGAAWVAPADGTAYDDAQHVRECIYDDCEEKDYEDCDLVWSEELSEAHTDTQPGKDVYVCEVCEYNCVVNYDAGHEYTLYYEAPTATEDGAWTNYCPICEDKEVTPITAGNPGVDVAANAWFYNYAQYCRATGLMVGNAAGEFNPTGTMTRGAFASVIARIYYGSADAIPTYTEYTLSDLRGKWYANAAQAMADLGIIAGSGGKFNGDNQLNTAAAIAMLHRLYTTMYGEKEVSFGPSANITDMNTVPSWFKEDVEWAAETGLVAGDANGRLNPLNPCKRQQQATLITKYDVATREVEIISPAALATALGRTPATPAF